MNLKLPEQYELQQRLDSSSIEETWKAFDTQRRLYVTLKLVQVASLAPSNLLAHFEQEMAKVAALQHPNIVPLLNYYINPVADGSHDVVVVTKYIEGPSLTDYLNSTVRKGALPTGQELIQLLMPIAAALDYAHQRGVLHSGIKPGNILFDKHHPDGFVLGEPYLSGFVVQQLHPLLALPLQDVYYISPEVARGYVGTERSDLYSLGVILYELCTGLVPFQGDTPTDVITQHIHAVPTSPPLVNPNLLPAVTAVIMRALAKEPATRFASARAMVAALAKAYNIPLREDLARAEPQSLSGISAVSMSYLNLGGEADAMNSPTYLSNPPQLAQARQMSGSTAVPGSATPVLPGVMATPVLPATSMPASIPIGPTQVAPAAKETVLSTPPVSPPRVSSGRRRGYILLSGLVVIALLGSVLLGVFVLNKPASPVAGTPVIGHAFFTSSGLINLTSNQGIADGVQLNLNHLPPAQSGKQYYAWLLADNDNNPGVPPLLLGILPAAGGTVNLTYAGDASHSDLLANYSRLLITEEDVSPQPVGPSLDTHTWRYYAFFSQVPNPADTVEHFALLNHLRHLLAQDPKLKAAGLVGGLDIWLFRNTEKILEYAGSARDAQQQGGVDLTRRQLIRILDYLDGSQYIATEGLPPGTPLLIDPTIARVAMLEFDVQNQSPPGYLKHINTHLVEIVECPGVTADQRALAIEINAALNNVQAQLVKVHTDAAKLVHMSDAQLQQPQAAVLLNDLFTEANNAFAGQVDPNTNQVIPGVVQIHYNIQRLATMDITACTGTGANPCV
jgi:serine/threonine protein kinase